HDLASSLLVLHHGSHPPHNITKTTTSALRSILSSLETESNQTAWRHFLHRPQPQPHQRGDPFELRDALLSDLCTHPSPLSFQILTRLIRLQCPTDEDDEDMPPVVLFGRDFIESAGAGILSALCYGNSSHHDENAAVEALLRALLSPHRPRNEVDVPSLRDAIFLPASRGEGVAMSTLADILCDAVVEGVIYSVPSDETAMQTSEEVLMKRETAALTRLQDWREVMENIARKCVDHFQCTADDGDQENGTGRREEGERIVAAFQKVYSVAPFALESQLETLLEDDAVHILSRLNSDDNSPQQEKHESVVIQQDDDIREVAAPLYANLSRPPMNLALPALETKLSEIHQQLSITDPERWDERLSALIDLECILASDSSLHHDAARSLFLDKLRKMPLPEQFCDLRSQVTHMACRVLLCTSFEYRSHLLEDATLASPLQQFAEYCLPSLMKLCTSGTRLMANQGVHCLQALCAASSFGHARLLLALCEEILDKKNKNTHRKRGAVMGLAVALRTWKNDGCLKNNVDVIGRAVTEANAHKDPGVREEGRRAYWAMVSCSKTCAHAEKLYAVNSREYKNLAKVRRETDEEWEEGGRLEYLVRTGILLDEKSGGGNSGAKKNDASNGGPPRAVNSNKRPASAGTKGRATPVAKTGRFSTPVKDPLTTASSASKIPVTTPSVRLPMNTPSSRRTTFASPATRTSAIKTPAINNSERNSMRAMNGMRSSSFTEAGKPSPVQTVCFTDVIQTTLHPDLHVSSSNIRSDEKENAPTTPVSSPTDRSSRKIGTPVVSLLARPSPLSIEKCRTKNVLGQVVAMLSDTYNPSEQYLGIQVLALFAKENGGHESWEDMFGVVLDVLLDQIKKTQTDQGYNSIHFVRSPSKNLGSRHEAQHLLLQGIRCLLQFVPSRFNANQIREVMVCLLECTNAPFEIVHTCERALQNLVTCTNPEICFECLLPLLTNTQVDLDSDTNPPLLLSALRTMKHMVEFVSPSSLRPAVPELLQLFHLTLRHKSVDMRKATVFVLVEMYYALGKELDVNGFSEGQKRLIDVYVERHPKRALVSACD
ncbi:hypothetical protein ACHAWX_003329, partial [Stephanocyclus meneghinianus]